MRDIAEQDNYRIEQLEGSINYRTWKLSMKSLLVSKDLWDVVNGEETGPDDEK